MQARAEFYVKSSQWDKAATYFAKSGLKFEDVAIKLLLACDSNNQKAMDTSIDYSTLRMIDMNNVKDLNYLKVFLVETLQNLPLSSKSQRTMLCIWICEIMLHQLQVANLNKELIEKEMIAEFQAFVRNNR